MHRAHAEFRPSSERRVALATALLTTADGRWHLGVGDPTPIGWITFCAYLATAVLAIRAFVAGRERARSGSAANDESARDKRALSFLWFGVALLMVLLGINKQLDLQTLFTEIGRDLALSQGWYRGRRLVQSAFILLLSLGGGALALGLTFALRRVLRRIVALFAGLCLIGAYILIRAAMFNHMRVPDAHDTGNLLWLIELAGISLVGFSAWHAAKAESQDSP